MIGWRARRGLKVSDNTLMTGEIMSALSWSSVLLAPKLADQDPLVQEVYAFVAMHSGKEPVRMISAV